VACTARRPSPRSSSSRSPARPASFAAEGVSERLRAICDRHGILLIFDEVITGFGRLGTPFAVDYFGVIPDLVTAAKGITNGVVPLGAVFASRKVHDALMTGTGGRDRALPRLHLFGPSGRLRGGSGDAGYLSARGTF
jgi:hypothetical protein